MICLLRVHPRSARLRVARAALSLFIACALPRGARCSQKSQNGFPQDHRSVCWPGKPTQNHGWTRATGLVRGSGKSKKNRANTTQNTNPGSDSVGKLRLQIATSCNHLTAQCALAHMERVSSKFSTTAPAVESKANALGQNSIPVGGCLEVITPWAFGAIASAKPPWRA